LFWIAIASVFFLSLWLFLWITSAKNLVIAKADRINLNIKDLQGQVTQAKLEQERRSHDQKPPEVTDQDRIELASARQLLDRKSFSWNKVIAEIERYVPKFARVTGLKIDEIANLGQDDIANIEIKVIGQTPAQMTEMMEMIEKSGGLFAIRQSNQDAPDESGEVPFTLNLIYSPSRGASQ
jgi:hypothetical protein